MDFFQSMPKEDTPPVVVGISEGDHKKLYKEVEKAFKADDTLLPFLVSFLQEKTAHSGGFFSTSTPTSFSMKNALHWLLEAFDKLKLPWTTNHAISTIKYLYTKRNIDIKGEYNHKNPQLGKKSNLTFTTPLKSEIQKILHEADTTVLGFAFSEKGFTKKHPVVIVPGLGASSLSVWGSEYRHDWVGTRIWLDFAKVGSQIKTSLFSSKTGSTEEQEEFGIFVRHMLLSEDGHSDPPGIRVRCMDGLEAISSLAPESIGKGATTIFAEVIKNLLEVGYDKKSLMAAPYDWRIPACKLEERDGYFTLLKSTISNLYELNDNNRVVMMCHSNGNRMAHYFTYWVEDKFPGWSKKHIHGILGLCAPYLGAPKMARAVITGDALGLDVLLPVNEEEAWGRHMGAYPCLMPLQEHLSPSKVLMLHVSEENLNQQKKFPKQDNKWNQYRLDKTLDPTKVFPRGSPSKEAQPEITESTTEKGAHTEVTESTTEFIEILPHLLNGMWHLVENQCFPPVGTTLEDILPRVVSGDHRPVIVKLVRILQSPSKEIHTDKRGFKEAHINHDGSKKTIHYRFGTDKPIPSLLANKDTSISTDGKRLVTTFSISTGHTLRCVSRLSNTGNTLTKWLTLSSGTETLARLVREYEREVPITKYQGLITGEESVIVGQCLSPRWDRFLASSVPNSFQHFQSFFLEDPYIIGDSEASPQIHVELDEEVKKKYPVFNPPLVDNIVSIYGVGKDTELCYYLASNSSKKICLYPTADGESKKQCPDNPAGLVILNGVASETKDTPQKCEEGVTNSGDGTVPYYSLSHCKRWNTPEGVTTKAIELENQEHTDILKSNECIYHILKYLTQKSHKHKHEHEHKL